MKATQYKSGDVGHLPKLKGTGVQCRWLGAVMADVFENFMDTEDENHKMVLLMLCCLRDGNQILWDNRRTFRFPPDASAKFIELSFQAAQATTALIRAYHPGVPLFHYTMKMHWALHIALATAYTNPWLWDCGSGEDLMKTIRKLMQGSKAGVPIWKTGNISLEEYLKAFRIMHNRDARWWK